MSKLASDLMCTCLRMDVHERMALWRRRALPTVRRRLGRGNAVASKQVSEVLGLIEAMDRGPDGAPEAFSRTNWHRSHHLPVCPCSNRANPTGTLAWGAHG